MTYDPTRRCPILAHYRFTWPGKDESWICAAHAPQPLGIAHHMGLHLQLVPLGPEELGKHTCQQVLTAKEQDVLDGMWGPEKP